MAGRFRMKLDVLGNEACPSGRKTAGAPSAVYTQWVLDHKSARRRVLSDAPQKDHCSASELLTELHTNRARLRGNDVGLATHGRCTLRKARQLCALIKQVTDDQTD